MPENAQVRTDSDGRQFLQIALSESVEQSGGNFNKNIGDLANAGKLNVRAGVYDLAASKISLSRGPGYRFSMEPNNLVRVPLSYFDRVQHQWVLPGFCWYALRNPHWGVLLAIVFCCVTVVPARAQQQQPPEDPEDDKQIGLWLDQGISAGLSTNKSLEVEFHERFDEGASNLYEYFVQGGVAFRLRPWVTVIPIYRYQRYPGNPTVAYENRLQLNITLSTSRGAWRPNLRTLIEGRFPDNLTASARLRFRPGVDYTLPLRMARRPVLVVSNEFFIVPGTNSFAAGGSFTQNRFQVGVRLPITDSFSIRPYYLLQSVNLPKGWETNEIVGISMAIKVASKSK